MQRTFSFYKTSDHEWFVTLPEWKGDKAELQMVEGADAMLDMIANNGTDCNLELNDEEFIDADLLTLTHARKQNRGGGGDYLLEIYNGNTVNQKLWLCAVTEFVFGNLPQKIWFRKV